MTPVIHIVDDDASFRTAVGRLIEASGFRVASYVSGEDILERLPSAEPGCILLDLRMPGLSGADLQDHLVQKAPLLPIIYLTGHGDIGATVRAIKAGAEDFLEKPASAEDLLEAIRRALLQNGKRRSEHDRAHALRGLVANLTPREFQVFDLVVRGKRNKQVAFELGTSERTVKAHRHAITEKLEVNSLAEMVTIAERLGLIESRQSASSSP
jgi:FixJ family two-component response regulator